MFSSLRDKTRSFFQHVRQKRRSLHRGHMSHDIKLMKSVRKRRFPGIRQFLHIGYVFTKKEKIIFFFSLIVFVISLIWSLFIISNNYRLEVPAVSGEYVEGIIGGVQLINPLYAHLNDADQDLTRLIYSGLMRYDEERNLIPDIAVKYTISEDQKIYTFELKQHVVWHDGESMTADDILFTIEMIQDEEVNSPLSIAFQDVSIEKIDDFNITFVLSESFPAFLSSLTVGIVPEHIWQSIPRDQMRLANRNLQPIGTGPFVFEHLIKDDVGFIHRVELKRFEDFYRKAPYLKLFAFEYFNDYEGPNGVITALREQKIDGIHFVPFELREKVRRKNIDLYTLQLPQYTSLFFNLADDTLAEKDIRMALVKALDKQRIVSDVLENEASVIHGPILEDSLGYGTDITTYDFSVEDANALLDTDWSRISAEEYKTLLKEERLEQAILEIKDAQVIESKKEEGEQGIENGKEAIIDTAISDDENIDEDSSEVGEEDTIDTDEISQRIDSELEQEFNQAQLFYWYPEGGEDKLSIMTLKLATVSTPEYIKVAKLIAGYWQDIGIHVTIDLVDAKDLSKEVLKNRDYDVLLYGVIVGNDPDQYAFWHSSQMNYPGLNLSQYNNKDVDVLLEKIRETQDEDELKNKYIELQNALIEDIPAAFLYTPTYTYVLSSKMKGFSIKRISHPSDRLSDIADWYLDTKRIWNIK